MNRILSAVAALLLICGLSGAASATPCTSGYVQPNTCILPANIIAGSLDSSVGGGNGGVGTTTAAAGVAITYQVTAGSAAFGANGVFTSTIDASGNATFAGTLAVAGASTLSGAASVAGTLSATGAGGASITYGVAVGSVTATTGGVIASSVTTSAFSISLDGAYTTAQLQAKTPARAGMLVWNSTLGNVCVSTGATVQGYKLAGTTSTTCQ